MCDIIKPSFIPSPEIRQLRDLIRYRFKLTNMLTGEKTPVAEIPAAVDGAISPEQAVKLRQCLAHIEELEAHRNEIEQEILLIAEPFTAVLDLLYTLPGLDKNPMTAIWNMLSKLEPYNPDGFLEHRPVNALAIGEMLIIFIRH